MWFLLFLSFNCSRARLIFSAALCPTARRSTIRRSPHESIPRYPLRVDWEKRIVAKVRNWIDRTILRPTALRDVVILKSFKNTSPLSSRDSDLDGYKHKMSSFEIFRLVKRSQEALNWCLSAVSPSEQWYGAQPRWQFWTGLPPLLLCTFSATHAGYSFPLRCSRIQYTVRKSQSSAVHSSLRCRFSPLQ